MKEDYIVYEYISLDVKKDLKHMYIDCYKNFGWIYINDNEKRDYYINSNVNLDTINIKFKRDENLKNKKELNELQEKCERAFLTVEKLKKEPQTLATVYSLTVGFIATFFMIISILSIIEEKILWIPAILCGVIGICGSVMPYFIYKRVKNQKTIENETRIDKQQEKIHNIYEEVKDILSKQEN